MYGQDAPSYIFQVNQTDAYDLSQNKRRRQSLPDQRTKLHNDKDEGQQDAFDLHDTVCVSDLSGEAGQHANAA